jgi:hypothetical protein
LLFRRTGAVHWTQVSALGISPNRFGRDKG